MMAMVPWEYRLDFCRIHPIRWLNAVLAPGQFMRRAHAANRMRVRSNGQ